ncbi:hypothetical protein NO2_1659, partial [Candidatus Termititenax persephonae]
LGVNLAQQTDHSQLAQRADGTTRYDPVFKIQGLDGGVSFKLDIGEQKLEYRVVLTTATDETLIYSPEEYSNSTAVFVPWQNFHNNQHPNSLLGYNSYALHSK